MTGYLSPHSDIVALLVLEHQAQMLNLITRSAGKPATAAADAGRALDQAAAQLVDYMLFVDEAPLPGPDGRNDIVRRRVQRLGAARQPWTVAARSRFESAPVEVSMQLFDLLGAI